MASRTKPRFWRLCRIYFRRFRILVWSVLLVLLCTLLYLNQVGLPDFVKRPLLDEVRARGLDLQFSRLRLRFHEGIVAENVRFGRPDEPQSPQLTLAEVQVRLNFKALTQRRIQVDSLMLRKGRLTWPFAQTNTGPRELFADGIQSELRFLPDDQWALDHFTASFAGARIQLSGMVTNASAVRDWSFFQGAQPAARSASVWPERLRRLADTLEQIHFSAPPELHLDLRGDARDLQSFSVLMLLGAPGAETPWGRVADGRFTGRLFPADTNGISRAGLTLEASEAQTPWASITNFQLDLQLNSMAGQSNLVKASLMLSAQGAQTAWASGSRALLSAEWVHSITNPIPVSGHGRLSCEAPRTPWASARRFQFEGNLDAPPTNSPPGDASWAWWTNLRPYSIQWNVQASELQVTNLEVASLVCAGHWRPPQLAITNLLLNLYDGQVSAKGGLDAVTRNLQLRFAVGFDPHRIAPVLPATARTWLDELQWQTAPRLEANLSVVLPPWTRQEPQWWAELKPTLNLEGEITLDKPLTYRNLQISTAHSHVIYSNQTWSVPDLVALGPEGHLAVSFRTDDRTRTYYGGIIASIDPVAARPYLSEGLLKVFDLFTFAQRPAVEAEVWGQWDDPQGIGLKGAVALTNFTFRREPITEVRTAFSFTNDLVRFYAPRVLRGSQLATADGLAVDLKSQLVFLTNGFSTAEPMFIARAIGTNVVRAIEPYRFLQPPVAHVRGTIPLHGEEGADLHFDLDGGPFHWWKFNLPHISGHVHWAGLGLTLTNIQADFYGGQAVGSAAFEFHPAHRTDFQFVAAITNVLFHDFMGDMSPGTNRVEGRLNGWVTVTRADDQTWRSVFGFGEMNLRDGLLWDIPIFGIFSPALNGISPGLGSSRATAAVCSFVITNGVVRSEDMDIRSTGMRLKYRGTVDLESQVHARVEAELLRDMWLVGPVVSTVLWPVTKMFEYKVAGTLEEPKTEPVFIIPKLMLMPFHPFRTLKGLVPGDSNSPQFSPLPAEK